VFGSHYQLADGRQLIQLTADGEAPQRFALQTLDSKHLGYLIAEHVELPSRLPGELMMIREAKP